MEREANVGGILGQTADLVGSAGRAILIYVLVLGLFSGLGGLFGMGLAMIIGSFAVIALMIAKKRSAASCLMLIPHELARALFEIRLAAVSRKSGDESAFDASVPTGLR